MIYLFVLAIVWFWVGFFVWPIDFRNDHVALTYKQFKKNCKLHLLRLFVMGPMFAFFCIFCFLFIQTRTTLSRIIDSIDEEKK